MNVILSIIGLALVFMWFGMTYGNGRARSRCGACSHENAKAPDCASCDLVHDVSESIHGRS